MIASIAPRAFSVFERNVFVYRRQWLMIVTGFFEPLFFLLGIGFGVGGVIGTLPYNGVEVPYAAFVAPALLVGAVCVACAHLGGGAEWTLSSYGLQRSVRDEVRGRVLAIDYAMATAAIATSELFAGWLAGQGGQLLADLLYGLVDPRVSVG